MIDSTVLLGEGTLNEKRPGYFEYKINYLDVFGQRKRKSFSGRDINEIYMRAEEFIKRQEDKNRGIRVESTIPQILRRRYEADFEKGYVHEPGYYRNINSLKKIESSFIGSIPIAELTVRELEAYLASLTHYSNSMIGKTYGQLKLAYREALAAGIVTKNLMEDRNLRCPKSKKKDSKVSAFTKEDQEIFVQALKNYRVPNNRNDYRKQLMIELYTGMRMGEINALKPENVDFKKGIIHIRGTISMGINNRIFLGEHTKTAAGMRSIPMNDLVRPILKAAVDEMKDNPEGTIFYDYQKGNVISTQQVNCFFKRVCDKAGLEHFGQHSLRHTFATRCIEAGIQPIVLKTWLGHTNIHITLDTYSDVFDSMNNNAIDAFQKYLVGEE